MTGAEVQQLRSTLGLKPQELAGLVGVHLTTVYRWEGHGNEALRLEPLQHALLLRLQEQARVQKPQEFGKQLIEGLLVGGTLVGLAYLLADLATPKPGRRQR